MPDKLSYPLGQPKKRRLTELKSGCSNDDFDSDIIDVTPVKQRRKEVPSVVNNFSNFFKSIGEWFKRTSQHNTRLFGVLPESNSAEAAIAHGGQYLADASTDKFMPTLKTNGNGSQVMQSGHNISQAAAVFANGYGRYEESLASNPTIGKESVMLPSISENMSNKCKDGKYNQNTLMNYGLPESSTMGHSFEPEEQINGALHQSYIEQAAKRSGDTSRAGADNSALNSTVYDKHYNDANPLFPMFNFNKVSSNKTDKQISFDLEEKERYRRLLEQYTVKDEAASPNTIAEIRRSSSAYLATHPGTLSEALSRGQQIRKKFNIRPRLPLQDQRHSFNSLSPEVDVFPSTQLEFSLLNDTRKKEGPSSTPRKQTKTYSVQPTVTQPSEIAKKCDHLVKKMEELKVRSLARLAEQKQLRAEEIKLAQWEKLRAEEDDHLERMVQQRLKLSAKVILEDLPPPDVEEFDEFPELSEEAEMAVEEAWQGKPGNILSEAFRMRIKGADLRTLSSLEWLNDEIMNFYFNLIQERSGSDNLPSVHVFNTFFYPKVLKEGHKGVRRWTKQVDLFSKDIILIPVHLGVHWCLACIHLRKGLIQYFDSMGGRNQQCLMALKKYIEDESIDKRKQTLDTSHWVLECVQGIPQQMNGSDCGVFACKFAEYLSRDADFTFGQEHMPYFRKRMAYEILTKKLL